MFVVDTDMLTLAHHGHPKVEGAIRRAGEEIVATTIITAVEILRGRHDFLLKAADGKQLQSAQHLLTLSEAMLQDIPILRIDIAVGNTFDDLRQLKKLKKIGRADLLIACIPLAYQATLVTRNVKHFEQVPGLRLENWAD